jgi:23S rRNA G2445 N2-methylase RlmL
MVWYEASVVTGLEKLAAQEVREKLNVTQIDVQRGRLLISTDSSPDQVLRLRSVDNVGVIVYREAKHHKLPESSEDLRSFCEDIVERGDWIGALTVWRHVFQYDRCTVEQLLSNDTIDTKPKFRASCKRSGTSHNFASPEAAAAFGACLNRSFRWPVDLKQFDIHATIYVLDAHVYVSIALTTYSLHNRNLINFGKSSLRSTICYGILRLAELEPGQIVCDPLCGSGALLLEACVEWPFCLYFASDRDPKALVKVIDNRMLTPDHVPSEIIEQGRRLVNVHLENLPFLNRIDIAQLDATNLPFANGSIDRFVSDLPFGKRFGSKTINSTLYPKLLFEMARCARIGSGRAILLTKDLKNMINCMNNAQIRTYWTKGAAHSVNVGGLFATVYCLRRTTTPFAS